MSVIVHPRLFEMLTPQFYRSTVGIFPPVEVQNESGEETITYPAALSGHAAIRCQIAPAGEGEKRTPVTDYLVVTHEISLTDYYPLIETEYRAVDQDGTAYDITNVKHDSQQAHTVLETRIVTV